MILPFCGSTFNQYQVHSSHLGGELGQQSSCSPVVDSQITLNIVNLSSYTLSSEEAQVLHKGLGFCPNENVDKFEFVKDLQLFARKLILKNRYQKPGEQADLTPRENRALDQLVSLLESDPMDLINRIDLPRVLTRRRKSRCNSRPNFMF